MTAFSALPEPTGPSGGSGQALPKAPAAAAPPRRPHRCRRRRFRASHPGPAAGCRRPAHPRSAAQAAGPSRRGGGPRSGPVVVLSMTSVPAGAPDGDRARELLRPLAPSNSISTTASAPATASSTLLASCAPRSRSSFALPGSAVPDGQIVAGRRGCARRSDAPFGPCREMPPSCSCPYPVGVPTSLPRRGASGHSRYADLCSWHCLTVLDRRMKHWRIRLTASRANLPE